jgi:hypothetical protein
LTRNSYLHAVETRCHDVEAVLGILLDLPDQRAISLLSELYEDPYVRKVFDQVNASAFGPLGRKPVTPKAKQAVPDVARASPGIDCPFAVQIVLSFPADWD